MTINFDKKFFYLLLGVLLVAAGALSGAFDEDAEEAVNSALKRSLVTFGAARALNAVISTAQGTEVSVTPAGLGVTLTPGEVLDPVNDLVERFSEFMLVSSVALGVQSVLLEVSGWLPFSIILVMLGLGLALSHAFSFASPSAWRRYLWKVFVVLAVLRFMIPLALIGSDLMYTSFLEARHLQAEQGITQASTQVQSINDERGMPASVNADDSTWERLKIWVDDVKSKASSAIDLERYSNALEETTQDAIELIVVFFLNTLLFPLLIILGFWHFAKWALLSAFRPE